ncbi:MAG: bifunctional N(6)-L-threonylcarbamoyladenine synthase/serine/threonine protein kinase [DPANN group archaeon]|nr:bifunctional N(6)-L-threonylcarbamoyladenine synthase/serine/threonine protein kinase [DPANN group archaeon]
MITIGIEGTAHTFGIGIIEKKGKKCTILSSIKKTYFPDKGIHPREAAQHHITVAKDIYLEALKKAEIKEKDIDLVSFSMGPGLMPSLKTAAIFARTLSQKLKKPIIGVNHCVAHIEIGKILTNAKDPIVIFVSGGNSQIIGYSGGRYRIFGETLDIAVGNAIDKFARIAKLGNPGGPKLDKAAIGGNYIKMPYSVKGMDFSFSGLLTSASTKIDQNKNELKDICYSFRHNCFAMLTEVAERALSHTEKSEILVVGGVAASETFKNMLNIMCKERGAKAYAVPTEYSGDNGAMIAWQGALEHSAGREHKIEDTHVTPKWRTDQVEIEYIK